MGLKTVPDHTFSWDRSIRKTAETNPTKPFVFRWKWQAIHFHTTYCTRENAYSESFFAGFYVVCGGFSESFIQWPRQTWARFSRSNLKYGRKVRLGK